MSDSENDAPINDDPINDDTINDDNSMKVDDPPPEFNKIINDFITDILITFPEYSGIIARWWNKDANNDDNIVFVYKHCVKVFPERFFDILYKNVEIFKQESDLNTEFLPGIVFKLLWNLDISDNTRETIWKYLQLILFAVIGTVHNSSNLGDTAKLFEAINEEELKSKLEETLKGMQDLFESTEGSCDASGVNLENLPDAEKLHEHINSMMGGKLGKLALELAEEAASDLNIDLEDSGNPKDVFQKLFKNPGKMMNMVKNIGNKIDAKIKSGEIKESELMEEGMDLLNKMKNMPGMGDMQKMFAQMGMPGLGKGGKMNMGAMEAQLNRNMKAAKMKERFRAKVDAKKEQQNTGFCNMSSNAANTNNNVSVSDEELIKIFSTGEKVEKTPRGAKAPAPTLATATNSEGKKAKGKKKR